jgi:nucleotide-binding universal stress UspA family protein
MNILIASDGSSCARSAALYAGLFARPAEADITLLGVVEKGHPAEGLQTSLETLRDELVHLAGRPCAIRLRHGDAAEQILLETEEQFYPLVVIGSRGRQLHLLTGSTAQRLARDIKVPLLVVSRPREQVRQVLVCTSGERPGERDAFVGGTLALLVGARVTVLHVMSQVPLGPEAKLEDLERDVADLIAAHSREGLHLERTLDILAQCGILPENRSAKVRHGLVVDEILDEATEGDYDLVVIGAHQVPPDQRWPRLRRLLQDDIAHHILTHSQRPVLVVRSLNETGWNILSTGSASRQQG